VALDFGRGLSFWSPLEVPLRGQIGDSVAFALDLRGWFFPQPRKDYCMATLETEVIGIAQLYPGMNSANLKRGQRALDELLARKVTAEGTVQA
jgi:hypothetical protein